MQCPGCERPLRACLCACVRPLDNRVELLILQHPQEATEAKGTAALLKRCLSRCTLQVGKQFEPPPDEGRYTLLLYPPSAGPQDLTPPLQPERLADPATLRLVLLDATWRKSLRLLHENHWLQQLPRLPLQIDSAAAPLYAPLRRAPAAHQLSTLEAAALALQQLGEPAALAEGLRAAMADFVSLQLAWTRG
ncbi:tRNA-uridine aminocarboxypropyltransferase [Paucibacter sp. APW11]|uniref:tRNA-uridine aminocarboxypropyltransferase n=1 Tax=Roseateles aquae TaxID=3077235 RepID=A0ABU3PHG7_9BURK|nr:tRNA-uridine aminocarboxypropyltransferase [Paucibacter sp. APW11]MDT9002018.1 tRNA-uridine aminocarboxypropyltransferase [Paucibacter sp. APW11]